MFRFLCKNEVVVVGVVHHRRDFLSLTYPASDSLVRFISNKPNHQNNNNKENNNSFTVSYLINTCGLSQDKAILASKKVQFENSTKPDSVLTLFRTHEFPNSHISKIIQKYPHLLVSNVDKGLKLKLEFFSSLGLTGPNLAKYLSVSPSILCSSLEKTIIPSFAFLKTLFGEQSDTIFISILQRSRRILTVHPQKTLTPNIALLRAHGVPDSNILLLLRGHPNIFLRSTGKLKETIAEVKNIEIDASSYKFIRALAVWASTSESTRQAKVAIFKKWGWSDNDVRRVLRVKPDCMMLSAKNIMQKMEFLVNDMSFDPLLIANNPHPLNYSMEKRIIPRCSVIKILISTGLVGKDHNILTALGLSEHDFMKKYITRFEQRVPELFSTYKGRMID